MLFEQIQKNKRKTWLLYFLAFNVIELLVAILYIVFNSDDFFPLSKKDLIKAIAPKVGGGGGGRPDMAQASGKNPAGIPDALNEVANYLA